MDHGSGDPIARVLEGFGHAIPVLRDDENRHHGTAVRSNGGRFFEKHGIEPQVYAARIDRVPIDRLVSSDLARFQAEVGGGPARASS